MRGAKFGALAAIFFMSIAAQAYPSLTGPTGGAVLPTSLTVANQQLDIAADYYNSEDDTAIPVRLLYGIGNQFEIGGTFTFNDLSDVWGVDAKYRFEAFHVPLAIGALYKDANDIDVNATQVYLAYTTNLLKGRPDALLGTAGINWTHFDRTFFDIDQSSNSFRFYLAAEYRMMQNRLGVGAEYQFEDGDIDDQALMSLYARYAITPGWGVEIGTTNSDLTGVAGLENFNFFAGLKYSFGGHAEAVSAEEQGPSQTPSQSQTQTGQY